MSTSKLLTREEFTNSVLDRFGGKCCVPGCSNKATAAHHIVERKLWPDGGYYSANGAPLCDHHHWQAETTELSASDVRQHAKVDSVIMPPQFTDDDVIDKWGNFILPNGTRFKGELFHEEQVQKALKAGGMLSLVSHHTKHPRTWHLPWSPGATSDDRLHMNDAHLVGKRIIMTEKRDGECTTMYSDHFHARSIDGKNHPSRNVVKSYWSSIKEDIPEFWRVVGENLYAQHSISYGDLSSFFEGFFIWNDKNVCLSWNDTLEWFELIGATMETPVKPVPVLYDGVYDRKVIEQVWQDLLEKDKEEAGLNGAVQQREGYVIRVAGEFKYSDFRWNVAKFVRPNHVTTGTHWMQSEIIPNKLR